MARTALNATGFRATIERQLSGRFRSAAFLVGAGVPVTVIGLLLVLAGTATDSPAMTMFLAVLSALWIGGSGCVREIVDERMLVQRDPHLSMLAYGLAKIIHATLLAAGQGLILTLLVVASGAIALSWPLVWLLLFLTTLAGALMALILSALCDQAATALAWFPLILVPQVIFGGFLFPYGETRPFVFDEAEGRIIEMPQPLVRRPVEGGILRGVGALMISRWSLEGYAAKVYESDLSNDDALREAVQVSMFVPVTLTDAAIGKQLLEQMVRSKAGLALSPALDAGGGRYIRLLWALVAAKIFLLLLVLPVRDPRRA